MRQPLSDQNWPSIPTIGAQGRAQPAAVAARGSLSAKAARAGDRLEIQLAAGNKRLEPRHKRTPENQRASWVAKRWQPARSDTTRAPIRA